MSRENRFYKADMQYTMEISRLTKTLEQMKSDAKKVLGEFERQSIDSDYKKKLEDFVEIAETILKNPSDLQNNIETLNKMVLEGSFLLEKFDLPSKK